jgi:hypothetical protein
MIRKPGAQIGVQTPLHLQGDASLQLEIYDNTVYVFRKFYNKTTKQTEVYRTEYFGWVFHPFVAMSHHLIFSIDSLNV